MPFEFSPKEIRRAQEEAKRVAKKELLRKLEVTRAKREGAAQHQRNILMHEGATFTKDDQKKFAVHTRSNRTSAGDGLPKGSHGGRFDGGRGLDRLR